MFLLLQGPDGQPVVAQGTVDGKLVVDGGGGGGGGDATLAEQQVQSGLLTTIAAAADVPTSDVVAAIEALGATATIADVVALLTTDATTQSNILAKLTEIGVDADSSATSLLAIQASVADVDANTDQVEAKLDTVANRLPTALGLGGGLKTEGVGVAGTPSGGVVSIQGVTNGTFVPITPYSAVHNSGSGVLSPPGNALPFTQVSLFGRDGGANVRAMECRVVDPVAASPGAYTRSIAPLKSSVKTTAGTPAASLIVRAGPCWLYEVFVSNQSAANAGYLTIYNLTSAPTHGAAATARLVPGRHLDTKVSTDPFNFKEDFGGLYFSTGCVILIENAEDDATVNTTGAQTMTIQATFVAGT